MYCFIESKNKVKEKYGTFSLLNITVMANSVFKSKYLNFIENGKKKYYENLFLDKIDVYYYYYFITGIIIIIINCSF